MSIVVEESSGGVIANSVEDAIGFVNRNFKNMPSQIEESKKRLKHSVDQFEFWSAYYR